MSRRPLYPRSRRALALVPAAALLVAVASSCAVFNPDKTPSLRAVDTHLLPARDSGWRPAAVLALLPVGAVAAVVDQAIVIPATQVDDAWRDTRDALWVEFDWDEAYVTEMTILPLRVVATPLLYVLDLGLRTIFDIPFHNADGWETRPPDAAITFEADDPAAAALAAAEAALAAGDAAAALEPLRDARDLAQRDDDIRERYEDALVAAAAAQANAQRVDEVLALALLRSVEGDAARRRLARLRPLLEHADAAVRLAAVLRLAAGYDPADPQLLALAADPAESVRLAWIDAVGSSWWTRERDGSLREPVAGAMRRLALGDPSEAVRIMAARALRSDRMR